MSEFFLHDQVQEEEAYRINFNGEAESDRVTAEISSCGFCYGNTGVFGSKPDAHIPERHLDKRLNLVEINTVPFPY